MSILSIGSDIQSNERKSQGKGWLVSLVAHLLIIAIFFLPMVVSRTTQPELEGLLVNLGLPDQGQGEEIPKGETQEITPEPTPTVKPNPVQPQVASAAPVSKKETQKVLASTEDSNIKVREAEARAKAEADARARAEEAAKTETYNQTKKTYGDLLGGGGKGNTGKPGSQGDPNGDPNSNILEGISKGSGRVGGGLSNRGVVHEPKISDKSQKTGRVVLNVCVDKVGKVIKAEYTQKGSTTTDSELKEIARKAALQFRFTDSDIEEQCGTITVDFIVRG